VVEGTVVGTGGQPLDEIVMAPVFSADLLDQWAFAKSSATTHSDGKFSLPIEIRSGDELTEFPETVSIYVAGLAEAPKYPAPPGRENIVDSVAVTVHLKVGDEPPPVVSVTLQLPISE
jgi:hypothetical protein